MEFYTKNIFSLGNLTIMDKNVKKGHFRFVNYARKRIKIAFY